MVLRATETKPWARWRIRHSTSQQKKLLQFQKTCMCKICAQASICDQHLNWIFVCKVAGAPSSRVSSNCRASHTQRLLCQSKALASYQPHGIKESNPSWITTFSCAGNIIVLANTNRKIIKDQSHKVLYPWKGKT